MKDALAIHRTLLARETMHEIVRLRRAITTADELPEVLDLPAERCLAVRVFSVHRVSGGTATGAGGRGNGGSGASAAVRSPAAPSGTGRPVGAARRHGPRSLVAVIVPAGADPSVTAVRAATGARRAYPAPADLVNAITDYAAPLVAPLLLPDSVQRLVDREIVERLRPDDVVYTTTGEACTALGIRTDDLIAVCSAKPVDLGWPARYARRLLTERIPGPRRTRGPDPTAPAAIRRQVDQGG